jgi:hypothetical protein
MAIDFAVLEAVAAAHNRRTDFQNGITELERICRSEALPSIDVNEFMQRIGGGKVPIDVPQPVAESPEWFAKEILDEIGVLRHWGAQGHEDAVRLAVLRIGMLAARAGSPEIRKWTEQLVIARKAGRVRGEKVKAAAQLLAQRIRRTIARYSESDERVSIRKLARDLDVSTKTIERHVKKMGLSIPAY